MILPFSFPPWVPWWVPVAVLVPALLYGLFFLAMPFAVFGVKSRLDVLEARLDEIQGEIRALALRLPEPDRGGDDETPPRARREAPPRPPIPPAPVLPPSVARAQAGPDGGDRVPAMRADRDEPRRRAPPPPPPPARRSEPRIDWPRPNP
jgi:hypothetical protein